MYKDINCGIVYNFEKPQTNQISTDGEIKQIGEIYAIKDCITIKVNF